MAGEIQLNSTTMATESSGTITLSNVDSATNRTNLGLGSMATQNANAVAITGGTINTVAITGGTINTVQPATGESLTIKDEDGNTAITVGTDNTAAGYLSLNFGSYHGDSGGAGSGTLTGNTLDDYEDGTYTVSCTCSGTGTITVDPTLDRLSYQKIGKVVTVWGQFSVSSVSSPNGKIQISLPFTSASGSERSNRSAVAIHCYGSSSEYTNLAAYIVNGLDYIDVVQSRLFTSDTANALQTNAQIFIHTTYTVA